MTWASQPLSSLLCWALVFSTVIAQSCKWKNGQRATDYYSCDPTAAQSSCCLQGEACVGNGLCYGSLGQIYRGACSGGWGNDTACPQACNNQGQDGGWSNLYQCPTIAAASGATSWWCGDTSVVAACDESGTNSHPTKAQIFSLPWNGMLPLAIMPWPSQSFTGCAVSLSNQYSLEKQIENATQKGSGSGNGSGNCSTTGSTTGSSPASSTGSTSTPTTIQHSCPNGAQIGEGVVIGVLALVAALMAVWAFYERRQKNRLLAGGMHKQDSQQIQPPYEVQQPPPSQQQQYVDPSKRYTSPAPAYEAPNRPVPSEMDSSGSGSRPPAHEMQS